MISILHARSICMRYGAVGNIDGYYFVIRRGAQIVGRTMITDCEVARHAVELILGLKD